MIKTGMRRTDFEIQLKNLSGTYGDRHVTADVLQTKIGHLRDAGTGDIQSVLDGLREGTYSQPAGWYRALAHLYYNDLLEFEEQPESPKFEPRNELESGLPAQAQSILDYLRERLKRNTRILGCGFWIAIPIPFLVMITFYDLALWQMALYGAGGLLGLFIILGVAMHLLESREYRLAAIGLRRVFMNQEDAFEAAIAELRRRSESNAESQKLYQQILKTPAPQANYIHLSQIDRRIPMREIGIFVFGLFLALAFLRSGLLLEPLTSLLGARQAAEKNKDVGIPEERDAHGTAETKQQSAAPQPPEEATLPKEPPPGSDTPERRPPSRQSAEEAERSGSSQLVNTLAIILPYVLLIGVLALGFYSFQVQKSEKAKTEGTGKWHQSSLDAERNKTTFADIAGYETVKAELREVANYLQAPKAYEMMGTEVPRAILMVGPPGTGKTSLARAVASAAGVPFFSCAGSEFVEIYSGAGALNVRNLFAEARRSAPSIVFIDEIDAVARKRSSDIQNQLEADRTLNDLLVQLDGFDRPNQPEVIFMAATNLEGALDPALLQRMSRRISVPLPDEATRVAILRRLSEKQPISWSDIQVSEVASQTAGFSGRELRNLIDEAPRQTFQRLHREARQWCSNQRTDDSFLVLLPDTEGAVKRPVICAGCIEAGGRVKVKTSSRELVVDDTDEGVWSVLIEVEPGEQTLTLTCTDKEGAASEETVTIVGGEGRHDVSYDDVTSALERLGTTIPRIDNLSDVRHALDKGVVGQQAAKRMLAGAAATHYANARRIADHPGKHHLPTNVLLIGPPGVGKTLLAENLARHLNVPFSAVDAPALARDSSTSSIAQTLLYDLVRISRGKARVAEHGIVVIKNIDKLLGYLSQVDIIWREQVQRTVADLVSGKVVDVATSLLSFPSESVRIDTRNILFIFEGAFDKLAAHIERRQVRASAEAPGYQGYTRSKDDETRRRLLTGETSGNDGHKDELLKDLRPEDLESYGLIKDLVITFSVIVTLEELSTDDLMLILRNEGENNPVFAYQELLTIQGREAILLPDAYQALAQAAVKRGSGVHGLRAVLHHLYLFLLTANIDQPSVDERLTQQALAWKISEPPAIPAT